MSPTTGIRSPDRPALGESLYRLSYPGPQTWPWLKETVYGDYWNTFGCYEISYQVHVAEYSVLQKPAFCSLNLLIYFANFVKKKTFASLNDINGLVSAVEKKRGPFQIGTAGLRTSEMSQPVERILCLVSWHLNFLHIFLVLCQHWIAFPAP